MVRTVKLEKEINLDLPSFPIFNNYASVSGKRKRARREDIVDILLIVVKK